MRWIRVRAEDKLAFREDLQADPTLTDLQKRMISVIAQHWDGVAMHAECSLSFIAAGAGCKKKLVSRYLATILASGRVSIKRKATYTESTLWTVNWWLRGSAWVRLNNGGDPISDCREVAPSVADRESPDDAHIESPTDTQGSPPALHGGSPPSGGPIPLLTERDIGAPPGSARPMTGALRGAKEEEEDGGNPHKSPPGFAKWRIVHAEFAGRDNETFVAHLRSGNSRKFVLRVNVDSDEYGDLDEALGLDGDSEALVGQMVAMSTNRTGPKTFMRAAPLPWQSCTILSGESADDGSAALCVRFDDRRGDARINLSPEDAARLIAACGGDEGDAIGARVRYRWMPDDTIEFRRLGETGATGH